MTKTKVSIYKRNMIYFLTSFMWTATLSVIPQIFFMNNYPDQKNTLLSLFLLIGTVASIMGVLTSHGNKFYYFVNATGFRRNLLIVFSVFVIALTFSTLIVVKTIIGYFVVFIIFKFISNLFYNYIDRLLVSSSNQQQLKIHVRANLLFQLLGIMAAPFYFSFFASNTIQNIVLIWVISSLSLFFIYSNLKSYNNTINIEGDNFPKEHLSNYNKLFVTYSSLILCATTMLMSTMIYILRDYYKFNNIATKGGTIIGVISGFAVLSVIMYGILMKSSKSCQEKVKFSVIPNMVSLVLFIVTTSLFYFKISTSFNFILSLGAFSGVSFGIFLSTTRNYASAHSKSNENLISIYNNLPNYASLGSFLMVFIISLLSKAILFDFGKFMLLTIIMFFLLSSAVLIVINYKESS